MDSVVLQYLASELLVHALREYRKDRAERKKSEFNLHAIVRTQHLPQCFSHYAFHRARGCRVTEEVKFV